MNWGRNWLEIGKSKGYIRISQKRGIPHIEYPNAGKSYRFDNPEEKVRAEVYVELIEKYGYPEDRIRLEKCPPVREGGRPSDIVVYDLDDFPFVVIEVKNEVLRNRKSKQV